MTYGNKFYKIINALKYGLFVDFYTFMYIIILFLNNVKTHLYTTNLKGEFYDRLQTQNNTSWYNTRQP